MHKKSAKANLSLTYKPGLRVAGFVAFALVAFSAGSHNVARADTFQRIRTFDPTRGLVPGDGSQSAAASVPNYNQQTYQSNNGDSAAQDHTATPNAPAGQSQSAQQQKKRTYQTTQPAKTGQSAQGYQTYQPNPLSSDASRSDRSNAAVPSSEQDTRISEENSHHKHHHKFLFFGHRDDEDATASENDANAAADIEPTREPAPSIRSTRALPTNKILVAPPVNSTNYSNTSSMSLPVVVPRPAPQVTPPDPPQRPAAPAVDQNARLPVVQNGGAKPALAWRARAWKLAIEPEDQATLVKHPSRVFNCSVEEALNAVANCCKSKGAQIIGQSFSAGQLGARFADPTTGKAMVVFVVKSIGNNRTIVKACADSDRAQKIALVNDLILQAAAIIDGKGLL